MLKRILGACIGVSFILCGCTIEKIDSNTVGDHCWNENKTEEDYTIYIEEDDKMVPYLVIDKSYNGSGMCLFLRKNIIDEPLPFNENKMNGAYYCNSFIDMYLNEEFYKLITNAKNYIANSDIQIVAEESLGMPIKTQKIETITRKIFLLSEREVWGKGPNDGKEIPWFSESENRTAYYSDNESGSWALRTCAYGGSDIITAVGKNGTDESGGLGGGDYDYLFGIRPAFCVDKNTPVYYVNGHFCLNP